MRAHLQLRGHRLEDVEEVVVREPPPLTVEDWGSPHLDLYAAREGYWRPTPCLVHLMPPEAEQP